MNTYATYNDQVNVPSSPASYHTVCSEEAALLDGDTTGDYFMASHLDFAIGQLTVTQGVKSIMTCNITLKNVIFHQKIQTVVERQH